MKSTALGDYLRELRESKKDWPEGEPRTGKGRKEGWTQQELADVIEKVYGFHTYVKAIQRLEAGTSNNDPLLIRVMAALTNVPPSELGDFAARLRARIEFIQNEAVFLAIQDCLQQQSEFTSENGQNDE